MGKYWELTRVLPNELNHEVCSDFLLSLKLANRSHYTIVTYRQFLERFFVSIQDPFTLITSEAILQWFKENEWHKKEASIKLRLSILASFYTFCIQEEYLEHSPIKSRWFPRLSQPIPKYLEKEEVAKTRQQSEKDSLRNQVIIEFMLTSGCRVGEVHRLNREDVDLENHTAKIVGKGGKIRQVHFSEKCALLLERYLVYRPKEILPLFVTTKGKRLGISMMQKIVKKIGEEAGLLKRLHPHQFRHTFATQLLAKGAELSFIMDELGHSNLATAQIYARLPKKEIIAQYRKFMG